MLKSIVEFLGLGAVINWLRPRLKRDNSNATATVVLALATIALSFVAGLQWRTFEKTDLTLRNQQRAFVSFVTVLMVKHPGEIWYFVPQLQNNGMTPTKNLIVRLACGKIPETNLGSRPMLLGPRQQDGAGACVWTSDFLSEKWKSRATLIVQGEAT